MLQEWTFALGSLVVQKPSKTTVALLRLVDLRTFEQMHCEATLTILLDIRKAFGKVWTTALI
jgi:hypothetical protein